MFITSWRPRSLNIIAYQNPTGYVSLKDANNEFCCKFYSEIISDYKYVNCNAFVE